MACGRLGIGGVVEVVGARGCELSVWPRSFPFGALRFGRDARPAGREVGMVLLAALGLRALSNDVWLMFAFLATSLVRSEPHPSEGFNSGMLITPVVMSR